MSVRPSVTKRQDYTTTHTPHRTLNPRPVQTEDEPRITLDESQQYALQLALSGAERILILGAAGTGKSTVIKAIQKALRQRRKKVILMAPTGVAAINIGGATIHSQLEIGTAVAPARSLRYSPALHTLLQKTDTVIVDEISMVRSDLMEAVLKRIDQYNPRIQLILVGDLMQLPPVLSAGEMLIFKQTGFDPSFPYFIDGARSVAFNAVILKTCHRQESGPFLDGLNKIRMGKDIPDVVAAFNANCRKLGTEPEPAIYLTATNQMASQINEARLASLRTEPRTFKANIRYYISPIPRINLEKEFPAPETLTLKQGANVMITKNIYPDFRDKKNIIPNGAIGKITNISSTAIDITLLTVRPGYTIKITPETWEKTRYTYDAETETIKQQKEIEFTQFPLKLAWAITIHKSQGLTLENYAIDLGENQFTDNLAYVALSRGRKFEDITLLNTLQLKDIQTNAGILKLLASIKDGQKFMMEPKQPQPAPQPLPNPRTTKQIIACAINTGRDIEFDYINNKGETSRRWATPITCQATPLGHDGLKAYCHLRGEERLFNIDKITNIKLK
ncbi:AAA family ATPase [Synergistes jonesii]|uniref:AAA family ATPase n=1 Tax=Synergistes jonesii TaxID=2754 RepID=UPI00248E6C0B|nr:AAA family ATPase [Synergistes jonesii]